MWQRVLLISFTLLLSTEGIPSQVLFLCQQECLFGRFVSVFRTKEPGLGAPGGFTFTAITILYPFLVRGLRLG